jgi:oligopeptide/dipeptide ABC transporter ATP-binding protein
MTTASPAAAPVLELIDGSVRYATGEMVSHVTLRLRPGEILGLVGESGCGKSTTARAMLGLVPLAGGELRLRGEPATDRRALRSSVQAIFQNPAASFNPKRSLLESVMEPLRVHRRGSRADQRARAVEELARVGISEQVATRRPSEVSGGQCQRAAIARATVLSPEVLVCDEPVSALDVSIQAQILELLAELRAEQRLAILFISHDLGVVASLCDRTAVMFAGTIVEEGGATDIAMAPQHPYSLILHESAPELDRPAGWEPRLRMRPGAEDVDGRTLPGCRFAAVCPRATAECEQSPPPLQADPAGRAVACIHPLHPVGPRAARPDPR